MNSCTVLTGNDGATTITFGKRIMLPTANNHRAVPLIASIRRT